MKMPSSSPRHLPTDYQRLCPRLNRSRAEEIAHWVKNPTFVYEMFYTFIFQDVLRFETSDKDIMVNLAEAIENYRWGEFET